jgi:hypothetical protein
MPAAVLLSWQSQSFETVVSVGDVLKPVLERCAVILDHCTFYPLVRDVSDTPNLMEPCLTGAIAGVVQFH